MFKTTIRLKSQSSFSFSKQVMNPKKDNETHEEHEWRTWREKAHTNGNSTAVIPGMMFKKALENAGARLGKIPGAGNATYTKHFLGGVQIMNDIDTGVEIEDMEHEVVSGSSDGTRGGSRRVSKVFPIIDEWEGELEVIVTDDTIDTAAFEKAWNLAGLNIGIGRFRPANGGNKGLFSVESDFVYNHFDDPGEVWKTSKKERKRKLKVK